MLSLCTFSSSSFVVVPGFCFGPNHRFYLQYHFFDESTTHHQNLEGGGKTSGDHA